MLLFLWQGKWGQEGGVASSSVYVHINMYNVVQSGASTWIKSYPAGPLAYPYHCAPFVHQSIHSQPTLIIHYMHGI